jgi:hypothetical protein
MNRREFLQSATVTAAATVLMNGYAKGETMQESSQKDVRATALYAYNYHDDPYPLNPGPHLFIDWRYVFAGGISWQTADGNAAPLFAHQEIKGIRGVPFRVPYGLKLVPQKASKIGPIIPNDRDWEFMIVAYVSLHDIGGKFGLWYECVPPGGNGNSNLLCYAESTDGVNWIKPELGLVDYKGSKKNNIVIDGTKCPYGSFHGSSVFVDHNADANERFKVIYMSYYIPEDVIARLKSESPGSVDAFGENLKVVMLLGKSPDGLRWTFSDKPLFCHVCDTQTCVAYDTYLKRWVAFTRMWQLGRRAIGRMETSDITRWPVPETVLWTPTDADAADDIYCNSKSLYPGTSTIHIMFPTMYLRRIDGCAMRLASSVDTLAWEWLPGELMQSGPDEWDAGCFFVGSGLTEIPGDMVVIPYGGYAYPHKYPRWGRMGQLGLAAWKKERIVALQASEEAEFWTVRFTLPGDRLYLNCRTHRAGYIKVEVADVDGRSLGDCDPIVGDHIKVPVTWRDNPNIGVSRDRGVSLRFRMRSAGLYSFEVK